MRFASKGQPRASASRSSCALSPAPAPRSTQTSTRGGASLGGPSASPTLTAIFTSFPVFFKGTAKNFFLLTNHEEKYNPLFYERFKSYWDLAPKHMASRHLRELPPCGFQRLKVGPHGQANLGSFCNWPETRSNSRPSRTKITSPLCIR